MHEQTLIEQRIELVSLYPRVMHFALLLAAVAMSSSIFVSKYSTRWTPAFMLGRLTKILSIEEIASFLWAIGTNNSIYSIVEGKGDATEGYGSAYYISQCVYTEHPQHVPLEIGKRFRPPPIAITISKINS